MSKEVKSRGTGGFSLPMSLRTSREAAVPVPGAGPASRGTLERWRVAAGAAWLALALGCTTPPQGLTFQKGVEQDDFPVPRRFELKESRSLAQELLEPFRSWEAVYRGKGSVLDLTPWYVHSMQEHQWKLTRITGTKSDKSLTFEKGNEEATVALYREMAEGEFATVIRGSIHPKGPESLSVDEHLRNLKARQEGSGTVEPASYKEPAEAESPASSSLRGETSAPPPSQVPGTAPRTSDKDLEQINRYEDEYER